MYVIVSNHIFIVQNQSVTWDRKRNKKIISLPLFLQQIPKNYGKQIFNVLVSSKTERMLHQRKKYNQRNKNSSFYFIC
jgi:hypothetical protein